MTFGLKNASATYQRAMNLIFHDLLGVILEVYIDDIVIKSAGLDHHLADLRLALERMCRSNVLLVYRLGSFLASLFMRRE